MRIYLLILFIAAICGTETIQGQTLSNVPKSLDKQDLWTKGDLIQPADLAAILTSKNAKKPIILNIGVVEDIDAAKKIGPASKEENLEKLKANLKGLPQNTFVVIYCGCCPFEKCPNIRPAFNLMKSMGFSNGRLLNIPVNLKQNWISKGYPMLPANKI